MALSIVGSSAEVIDPVGDPLTFTFTPDSTWEVDDILCGLVMLASTAGTIDFPTDDTGLSLNWHKNNTNGVGKYAHDGVHTYFAIHARIPLALDGSSDPIVVTVDVTSALTYGIALPGLAVRGAKRLATRHTGASTASSDQDHSSALSVGTLPAHVRSATGSAGAVEYAVGNNTSTGYTVSDTLVMTFASATLTDPGSLHQNFDGARDILLAHGYRLHAADLPTTETAASLLFNGSLGGYILRFLWEFDLNVAPTVTASDAVDNGSLEGQVTIVASDWEDAHETTGIYPGITEVDVDWDDGDTETVSIVSGLNYLTHTYAAGGTYNPVFTVTDEDGATDDDTIELVVVGAGKSEGRAPFGFVPHRVDIQELPYSVHTGMVN